MTDFSVEDIYSLLIKTKSELHYLNSEGKSIPMKEKLLSAHRAGIKQVIIPKENEKNLVDIPKKVKEDIKITAVETVDEVLKIALKNELKKIEWTEVENISESKKEDKSQASIQ